MDNSGKSQKFPKENAALSSAPRAGPGIHFAPRAGMPVHVRPGIQVQAAHVEPPTVYNP